MLLDLAFDVVRLVIDRGVVTGFFDQPLALLRSARDAHGAAAGDLGKLPHDRTGRASGARNQHGIACNRLADLEQPAIGGESGCAEHRKHGGGRQLGIDLGQPLAVVHEEFGPAGRPEHEIADCEFAAIAFDHFADPAAAHHIADVHRGNVIGDVLHPALLRRVEAEIVRLEQHLALAGSGQVSLDQFEIAVLDPASARMPVQ